MAKKTTMKRKMKKRGSRRCWGGGPDSKRSRKPSEKGQAYKASITAKTVSKIQNKELKTKVDDLAEAFGNAMKLSSPK
jgi:hypothetical protein